MDPNITPRYLKIHKDDIIYWSKRLSRQGILKGYEGNLSIRLGTEYILITRSLCDKGNLQYDDIVLANMKGELIHGFYREDAQLSSEFLLHKEVYQSSPQSRSVIHAHPAHAIIMTLLNWDLSEQLLPEGIVYFDKVGLAEISLPGSVESMEAIRPHLPKKNSILLQNHGALTHGAEMNIAGCLMEMLEKLCYIHFQAKSQKNPKELSQLPVEMIQALEQKHKSFTSAINESQ